MTVRSDPFADNPVEMVSEEVMAKMVEEVNKAIDIPLLAESMEQKLFQAAVREVNEVIYESLPAEVYETFFSPDEGFVEEKQVGIMQERLVNFLNKEINMPFLSEAQEELVIGVIVKMLMEASKKENSLPRTDHSF